MTYQIAYVKTNQELSFRDWLTRHEIECYLPITKIQVKPRGKRSKIIIERAVFPHYCFVRANEKLNELLEYTSRQAHGFMNWLQFGDDDICTIEDEMVMELKETEARGTYDKIALAPALVFRPGVKVKVLTGAFSGFIGVVVRGPKRQAVAKIEIHGKIVDMPIALLAMVL